MSALQSFFRFIEEGFHSTRRKEPNCLFPRFHQVHSGFVYAPLSIVCWKPVLGITNGCTCLKALMTAPSFFVGGGGLERDASGSENIFLFWLTRSEEIGAGGKLSFFCAASNTLSRKLSSVNQPKAPFSGVSSLDKKPR